ncbi:MAG: class I SAM-dependent methyltransferase [Candidatus Poribacteria bacterium]|nr:class I SAM-dependent methyltransferase [Candidatus Poribacteria bacterium]
MASDRIPYSGFAFAYDDMMQNVDYKRWVNYMIDLFEHYDVKPERVLDLACGTGSIAVPLASMGYEVTGIDRAKEMIEVGESKARRQQVAVEWKVGDMRRFKVDRPFDAVLCLYDSINYALDYEELNSVIKRVHDALEPDGLFIFDITTERNIVEHFHLQTFAENRGDYSYVWKNIYAKYDKICRTELTFFLRKEGGLFERHVEMHLQKIFEMNELKKALKDNGFQYLSAFEAWSFARPTRNADRINITARKVVT